MAEHAQRKIAPIWKGAWVRLRLNKNRRRGKRGGTNNQNDDLDDFEIPDGVDEDDFLNDAAEKAGKAKKDVAELLRKRMEELDSGDHQNTSSKIPTPPPTNQSNFIGKRTANYNNNNKKLFVVGDDSTTSSRPFSPYPPPSTSTTTTTTQNSNQQPKQQQQQERASSATVVGTTKNQNASTISSNSIIRSGSATTGTMRGDGNNNNSNNNETAESDGWSSAITDLIKYRDRKRKAAQSARTKQDWIQNGPRKS